MFLSWLRSSRKQSRRPAHFQPTVEPLCERIVPANAHFIGGLTSSTVDAATGALVVNFKEAGLGNTETVNITLTGDANATYQWFNKGGQNPMGQPFNVNASFSVSGTFVSDKNGEITGSFTVNPPGVNEFLSTQHAANWIPMLTVSYTNVVLTDTTNGVSTTDAGINLDQPLTVIQL
jgi:hypothetical protein